MPVTYPTRVERKVHNLAGDWTPMSKRNSQSGVTITYAGLPEFMNASTLGSEITSTLGRGSLGGMARPTAKGMKTGSGQPNAHSGMIHGEGERVTVEQFMGHLKTAGTTDVISLDRLDLGEISAACAQQGISHHTEYANGHMSILPDFCPPFPCQLLGFVELTQGLVSNGRHVMTHCTGGFGRTGTHLMAFTLRQIYENRLLSIASRQSIEQDVENAAAIVKAYRCNKAGEFDHVTSEQNPPGMLARLWEYRKELEGAFSFLYAVGGGQVKDIGSANNRETITLGSQGPHYVNRWQLNGFPKNTCDGSKIDGTYDQSILSQKGGAFFPSSEKYLK